jgi:hypothetical protein
VRDDEDIGGDSVIPSRPGTAEYRVRVCPLRGQWRGRGQDVGGGLWDCVAGVNNWVVAAQISPGHSWVANPAFPGHRHSADPREYGDGRTALPGLGSMSARLTGL